MIISSYGVTFLENYEFVRRLTIRGSKVRTLIRMIKTYQLLFGKPQFPLIDLSEELEEKKQQLQIRYYSLNDCVETIKFYIDEVFERKKYTKKEFKQKVFAGAKMVLLLQFLDQLLRRSTANLEDIDNNLFLVTPKQKEIFKEYWLVQEETLKLVKNLVLSQYIDLDEEEMDWIQNILSEIVEDE